MDLATILDAGDSTLTESSSDFVNRLKMLKRSLVPMVTILLARSDARLVRKTLDLTWETGAPNGVSRQMIFTNGQYPGPHLFFHEDDDVEVLENVRCLQSRDMY